ncbi:MAG TPA: ATP-binding protein [Gemmatimonadales bacterium]|nr:ATP-binding protein [Gemmatimonadales bacterium]
MAVSLRRTLVVRYGLTMAVALLGIALWAYLGMKHTLGEQLERSLETTFELQSIDLVDHGRITASPAPPDSDGFVRRINRLVLVRDSAGLILQANNPLARGIALDPPSLRRALAGERTIRTAPWWNSEVLALSGPVTPGSPVGAAVLEVAASLAPLGQASRRALYRMLATAGLGALATLVGAWWLARSALAPVEEIAAQARAIQGLTPGRRITLHADVEELQGLIRMLNAMLDRLERAYEWHRRMIRDLAHDLRTPITIMRAGIEVALGGRRSPDDYRRVLGSTLEEVDRLTLIGDALSLLGRLESGELTMTLQPTDLRLVATSAVARTHDRIGSHRVEYQSPAEPIVAPADPRLLGIALDQLLDNAMRYTPAGGPIEVALTASGDRVTLAVEDQGPGVPDEVLPHLFERFYRLDPARGRAGGPGLGLTVVATIADLHRGRAVAERGVGGGLRVRLELPRSEDILTAASSTPHPPQ